MNKQTSKMSITALVISLLPLLTLIPVFLNVTLSAGPRVLWAGFNMVCVLLGFILSLVSARRSPKKGFTEKAAMGISGLWMLLVIGILMIALISNLPKAGA